MRFSFRLVTALGCAVVTACAGPRTDLPDASILDAAVRSDSRGSDGPTGELTAIIDAGLEASIPSDASPSDTSAGGDVSTRDATTDAGVACGTISADASTGLAPPALGALQIATGLEHACARMADRTARCWGSNVYGQLGNGAASESRATPVMTGLSNVAEITAGRLHTCARLNDGSVRCWGANDFGQLGYSTTTTCTFMSRTIGCGLNPTTVPGISNAVHVAAGGDHTCALGADGLVRCWGENGFGQLGDGTTTNRATPVLVLGIASVIKIALGVDHTCALGSDGSVHCWGDNRAGQLGDGTTDNRTTPSVTAGLSSVTDLAAGFGVTCARLADATAFCWGVGDTGQLGYDASMSCDVGGLASPCYRTPHRVPGVTCATQVGTGEGHTCVITATGEVLCWGDNTFGQLGDGTEGMARTNATAVLGLNTASEVATGGVFSCVRLIDGNVVCWGGNYRGQLGDGTSLDHSRPAPILW